MGVAISFPIIFVLLMLQTTVFSQITLLNGSADLILIWLAAWAIQGRVKSAWIWMLIAGISVAFISALPWYVSIISYAATTLIARIVNRRVWQSPLIMMFVVTIIGSLLLYLLTYFSLMVNEVTIPWNTAMVDVIVPSILLNLLFSLPVYAIARDTAQWAYPLEVTE